MNLLDRWIATPRSRSYPLLFWGGMLVSCVMFRLWYGITTPPTRHLFSDAKRHWLNGQRFHAPDMMGSVDPMLYQLWIHLLQMAQDPKSMVVIIASALLSASLPVLWALALAELLPLTWAFAGAVAIGFMPSLVMIYSYFMNETLLMPLMAGGFWLTLRAMRTKETWVVAGAAIVWALACYTRIVALPLAVVCSAVLLWELSGRARLLYIGVAALSLGGLGVPACWHSAKNLNFCAPFGYSGFNKVYRESDAKSMSMNVLTKGRWGFASPSMFNKPFAPFSDWKSSRHGDQMFVVDPALGSKDFESALAGWQIHGPSMPWWQDKMENAIMMFFDPSWPDNNPEYGWGYAAILNRWLWLPLLFAVALWTWDAKPRLRDGLIPYSALLLVALLLAQMSAVMEGRYRKPLEPMLIAAAFILAAKLRQQGKPLLEWRINRLSWPMRNGILGGMKLKRDTALKIHYILDQLVPPLLRDCRWFMRIPMRLAFREHADTFLDFKEKAFQISEDEFRDTYRRVSTVSFERATDLNEASIKRIMEEVRGPKVLEVGCGKGFLARMLLERGFDLSVADIVIQEPLKALAPRLKYFEANMEQLPFADREFDTVICTHTLEHVRNLVKAVAELRRVAKRVIIVVPHQRPYKYTFDLHLNFFPYPHSLLSALGKTPAEASSEDVDGDLFYLETP